ncbi:MAG: type II toxin-antitoxin system VapC family toxin [Vicinamibacterales bacterium]
MKFWDASAIVPLVMAEPTTRAVQALAAKDPAMLVWWATEVECASAIARLEREGALEESAVTQILDRLRQLATGWHEVDPSDAIREAAVRFLRVHPLRAADALQLSAAFIAAERRPSSLEVVTLDDRLAVAARKEGFVLLSPEPRRAYNPARISQCP